MGVGNKLGITSEGYLADQFLVDREPVSVIHVLQERMRVCAIMKDGKFHKAPQQVTGVYRLTVSGGRYRYASTDPSVVHATQ